ncbi:MAG TPA: M20/M25/M40 family metallo-hydrolase [Pseudolysinimonas sp.]|jgi:acetylornithine deacetylase/succinyl-diaminopimelate desuccinylase-like protein
MTTTEEPASEYERWLPELLELMSVRSVGADPAEAGSMVEAAAWLVARFDELGAATEVVRKGRESVVLATVRAQRSPETAKTLLVYGHFDVQPIGDPELWEYPPWSGTIHDGWLYGRGSIDTKGHLMMYLEALRAVLSRGELTVNVRLVIDGAEESGGELALDLMRERHEGVDGAIIFDGPMIAKGRPAFYSAARGMLAYHLTVRTGARDLHSGQFGGVAMNAVHVLVHVLDAVLPGPMGLLPDPLRSGISPLPPDIVERLPELLTAEQLLGGEGSHPADDFVADTMYTRLWSEPSLDVNGIVGGEPHITHMVIPAVAEASISMRLGPGQDPGAISTALEALLREALPPGAALDISSRGSAPAAMLPAEGLVLDVARGAFADVVGVEPITVRAGGSLPLLAVFGELGIPTVMTGMDLPEGNIHAPNERLWLEHLPAGTAILERILSDVRFTQ